VCTVDSALLWAGVGVLDGFRLLHTFF